MILWRLFVFLFFFNDTATTEIYTLSLHDALPIWCSNRSFGAPTKSRNKGRDVHATDRKSTRLNSSHTVISYAVYCLKKTKQTSTRSTVKNNIQKTQCRIRRGRKT